MAKRTKSRPTGVFTLPTGERVVTRRDARGKRSARFVAESTAKRAQREIKAAKAEQRQARITNFRPVGRSSASAAKQALNLLNENTSANWKLNARKPKRYWEERWQFKTSDITADYGEIVEWRYAIVQNRTIHRFLSSRTVSILVRINDPMLNGDRWYTAAAAADYETAMAQAISQLEKWAESYGKDAGLEYNVDEDSIFTSVKEILILSRKGKQSDSYRADVKRKADRREKRKK